MGPRKVVVVDPPLRARHALPLTAPPYSRWHATHQGVMLRHSMSVFVKICGLTCAEDLDGAFEAGPDAVGFVFWPKSPRAVTVEQAAALWTRNWPATIARVGVFVNEMPETVARVAETARLDIVQLHGAEDPARYRVADRRIWLVRRLSPTSSPTPSSADSPDAYVLDSQTADRPGGTGVALDWTAAAAFIRTANRPVVLAGGLTPENVADAIRRARPWGVDVSSGVESRPGRKDRKRMMEFVLQCRSA